MTEYTINQTVQKDFHSKADWNNSLMQFEGQNIFQSYEWGELKEYSGWKTLRVVINNSITLRTILLAQVLVKNYFGIKVAWCPGGPLINSENDIEIEEAVSKFQEIIFDNKIINLRCNPYISSNSQYKKNFDIFIKPNVSITSPKSIILNVEDEKDFLPKLRRKHRYYVTQSRKHDITWSISSGKEASEIFFGVYKDMMSNKSLRLPVINIEKLSNLLGNTPDGHPRLFTFSGMDDNKIVSASVISIFNDQAFYHYAASNSHGRKIFASYDMVVSLINILNSMGVKKMDFGGLSQSESKEGVDFFKQGFNGDLFEKVGEFDVTKLKLYSFMFSKMLKFMNS